MRGFPIEDDDDFGAGGTETERVGRSGVSD